MLHVRQHPPMDEKRSADLGLLGLVVPLRPAMLYSL